MTTTQTVGRHWAIQSTPWRTSDGRLDACGSGTLARCPADRAVDERASHRKRRRDSLHRSFRRRSGLQGPRFVRSNNDATLEPGRCGCHRRFRATAIEWILQTQSTMPHTRFGRPWSTKPRSLCIRRRACPFEGSQRRGSVADLHRSEAPHHRTTRLLEPARASGSSP